MIKRMSRRGQRGQGLVEYALILVLVALVSIFILAVVGGGISHIFAIIAAILGKPENAGDSIVISSAGCWTIPSQGRIGLIISGTLNVSDPSQVEYSFEGGDNLGSAAPNQNGPFTVNPNLDRPDCPRAFVVQAWPPNSSMLAESPIQYNGDAAP